MCHINTNVELLCYAYVLNKVKNKKYFNKN